MSDLGSKAALLADINAKVTTNGNGENTGTRVRAALTNMIDTLANVENLSVTPFLYLTSGSRTGIYRYAGVYEGKGAWVLNGVTFDPDQPADSIIWVTGEGWVVTDENVGSLYTSSEDVATPDLVGTWVVESPASAPTPSILLVAGPTVQDALEQVAQAAGPRVYRALITQAGTSAPTALVLENTLGGDPSFSYDDVGNYTMDLTGLVTDDQYMVMHNGVISAEDPLFFSTSASGEQVFLYTAQGGISPTLSNGILNAASLTILAY